MTWIQQHPIKTIDCLLNHLTFETTADRIAALVTVVTVIARSAGWDTGPCPYFVIDGARFRRAVSVLAGVGSVSEACSISEADAKALVSEPGPWLVVMDVAEDWTPAEWWLPFCFDPSTDGLTVLLQVPRLWTAPVDFGRRTVRVSAARCTESVLAFALANKAALRAEAHGLFQAWGGNPLLLLGAYGSFERRAAR